MSTTTTFRFPCSVTIEAFNASKGTIQKRTAVNSAVVTFRPLSLKSAACNAVLFKVKDLNPSTKAKKNNTTASSSLLKIILYLSNKTNTAAAAQQDANYKIFSNFAVDGKLTLRVSGYQIMMSEAPVEYIVDILRLLAPKQLNKLIRKHAPPPPPTTSVRSSTSMQLPSAPFSDRTNQNVRQQKARFRSSAVSSSSSFAAAAAVASAIASPRNMKPVRKKTSFSNRSPSPAKENYISRKATMTATAAHLQDDRLALSPAPKPKPTKKNRVISPSSSSSLSSSSSTTLLELSKDQATALETFQQGINLFVTGPGGTGKSVLIRACVDWCNQHRRIVSITATTGVAACNVQGETIHAWSGVSSSDIDRAREVFHNGPASLSLAARHLRFGEVVVGIVRKLRRPAIERWRRNHVLIVDELSMMDDVTMDVLDLVGQLIRNDGRSWGGLQLLFSGDFLQLPPVVSNKNKNNNSNSGGSSGGGGSGSGSGVRFCFESLCFVRTFHNTSESEWKTYNKINERTRMHLLLAHTKKSKHKKKELERTLQKQQKEQNSSSTNNAGGSIVVLTTVHRQRDDLDFIELLQRARLGALTADDIKTLKGRIRQNTQNEQDHRTHLCTHVRQAAKKNKHELSKLTGLHITLQCQDFTSRPGLSKVLDSVCRAPARLELAIGAQVILMKTIDAHAGLVNGTQGVVVRFTSKTQQPVIRFHGVEEERIIQQETWSVKGGSNGTAVVASRRQLPLDLSWAISIHKSQGMTLSSAVLDLSKVFEYGQGYVALSRVKSLSGVVLQGTIGVNTFRAHPKVLRFYERIGGV